MTGDRPGGVTVNVQFKRVDSVRTSRQPQLQPEKLESRTLLSAFSTINTYSYPGGSPDRTPTGTFIDSDANSMAQDSAGNLYAAG